MRIPILLFMGFLNLFSWGQNFPLMPLLSNDLTDGADAIVRLHSMQVEVSGRDAMTLRMIRRVTVLNPSGNKYVNAYLGYDNSIKIKELGAVIYNASGKEIERIKEKNFQDVSAVNGATLYTDYRIKFLDYTPVHYPYTLEFHYEISTPNTGILPSWSFLEGYRISTEESRYEVLYASPGLRPEWIELNLEGINLEKSDNERHIVFVARGIKALQPEAMSPDLRKLLPQLKMRMVDFHYEGLYGRAEDWNALGKWISNSLLKGQDTLPDAVKAKVRDLVRGLTNPLDKARAIYRYVQQNTRYISVQVGIGGLKPVSAMEVDRVKYGDCKGLSNYTRALLQVVGVNAYYCHVEAGKEKVDFDPAFADLAQGNHAILAIEGNEGYSWIDCTSQTLPFGFLGDFTDDRGVLMVTPGGGEIVRTPAYLNEQNYLETVANCALDAKGEISGEITLRSRGIQYDSHLQVERAGSEQRVQHYKLYWPYLKSLKLPSITIQNNRKEVTFTEKITLNAANYAGRSGNLLFFSPNAFNRYTNIPERYKIRQLPFEVQRGFLNEDHFVIQLPQGYQIEALPEAIELNTKYGTYWREPTYEASSHSISYRRKLLIRAGIYPKEGYETYRNFLRDIASADNAQVVLIKS